MVQHADDSTNAFKNFDSVQNVVELINNFSIVVSPKLDIDKFECIL